MYSLLGKEGLENALDRLEVALRERNAVSKMETINNRLRHAIGQDFVAPPTAINDPTVDELERRKSAAIAEDPLIARYEEV